MFQLSALCCKTYVVPFPYFLGVVLSGLLKMLSPGLEFLKITTEWNITLSFSVVNTFYVHRGKASQEREVILREGEGKKNRTWWKRMSLRLKRKIKRCEDGGQQPLALMLRSHSWLLITNSREFTGFSTRKVETRWVLKSDNFVLLCASSVPSRALTWCLKCLVVQGDDLWSWLPWALPCPFIS